MPATSRNQRIAAAIAEHEPEKLYARNRGLLKMSHKSLHDYAATKHAPDKKPHRNKMLRDALRK